MTASLKSLTESIAARTLPTIVGNAGKSAEPEKLCSRSNLIPGFGRGRPYPRLVPNDESYVVDFDGISDLSHPQNWSFGRKIRTLSVLVLVITISTIGSGISAPATSAVADIFNVPDTVSLLATSLYLVGYALGPILWGPWSELQGRRPPMVLSTFGFSVFEIAVASSKDIQTFLICRFWSGFFGSSTLVIIGGTCSDMFDSRVRGLALTYLTTACFIGPLIGPIIGGFLVEAGLGWRWAQWILGICGMAATALLLFCFEETFHPQILVHKARQLRKATGNWAIHAQQEEGHLGVIESIGRNVTRPFTLLAKEPIILAITVYMSFVYALAYLSLASYPVIFQQIHGMSLGVSSLPGIGSILGTVIAAVYITLLQPEYHRKLKANGGIAIPEWRLKAPIVGGAFLTAGLFGFGWTGYTASIHWMAPVFAGLLIGFGTYCIFLPLINYIVDIYVVVAASALAANCFLRSITASAFPIFSHTMFERMGIQWAFTLLGCIGMLLFPIPILLYYYGPKLRALSKLTLPSA